ncbi:zinc-binding dehydrogenase [Halalkalicoccus sp. NIPERK01]|uniref:zinc-dependent alcohol dehydrogenase n=1 Tax=Halalkalicoccus sp. NIPERK01 TaxID=3053469 RepID=UPI00256E9C94|nr:alcohol dehydrogenase catalytic domain-containing protein [Halalkalicoccus sp. NIPERK01]MDL5363471.1 alcohol dehydrogenase catalytic domain-containing protein [Halalkalicoccus sp. NIPERK01]
MDAVVCEAFGEARVEDVPMPSIGATDVLVEVKRVQLSVTECNLYHGEEIAHYETVRDRLDGGSARLFGHEFCGEVVEVGDEVASFEPGDRVYAPGKIPCGECNYCTSGRALHCTDKTYIGYDIPGALAEYVSLPAEPLCRVPEGVSDAEAAAMQPLASSVLCLRDAGIEQGDIVAVVGTGVMGFQSAQLALLQGASDVIVVDIDPRKLDIAARHGLSPIDATSTDAVTAVRERTGGIGADVVIEAVGGDQDHGTDGSDPLAQAVDMVTRGGTVLQVGYIIGDLTVTPRTLRSKSVDWINPVSGLLTLGPGRTTGTLAARLVEQGRISIDDYITHELSGLDSFERAVEMTLHKEQYGALGPAQIVLS